MIYHTSNIASVSIINDTQIQKSNFALPKRFQKL